MADEVSGPKVPVAHSKILTFAMNDMGASGRFGAEK